jgi:dTDP-4-dehydrorhamnose reductase
MKILVFGKTGQLATELRGVAGSQFETQALGRADADLNDPAAIEAVIARSQADVVINAAAYTDVDLAESNEVEANRINAQAPTTMAEAAAKRDIPFLHVSTDYVFDGSGSAPWRWDDPIGPLGVYGASKLKGEQGVRAAGGGHAILRTSWVVSAHGNNFVKTMLRLGGEREALSIVADQIGGPTPARAIAGALIEMAVQLHSDRAKSGTYHFSGAPDVSWADFAREIFAQANITCSVTDIPTSDFPTPATRPNNSRLDCTQLETVFGIKRPDWRVGLADILTDLKEMTS